MISPQPRPIHRKLMTQGGSTMRFVVFQAEKRQEQIKDKTMTHSSTRVVVTGIGAVTPLGPTAETTWTHLKAGRSGIQLGQTFDSTPYPVKIAAEVNAFKPSTHLEKKTVRKLSRFSQFAMNAAYEALSASRLIDEASGQFDSSQVDVDRAGVILGTCVGGMAEIRQASGALIDGGHRKVGPSFIIKMLHNAPASNISRQFGLRGYNSTISTSCAAGAHAIGEAAEIIRSGRADMMLAGGAESPISDVGLAGFFSMRALTAKFNDRPTEASRPFDAQRDGLVISEGGACVVLERYDHAVARGAPIYGELIGFGCSSDAFHMAAPDIEGGGQIIAIREALRSAELQPQDIDYISAHATSTPLGDAVETLSIKNVFGEFAYDIPVSAAKSMLGHSIGASGAIEAVVSLLSIRDQVIHPTINLTDPDPACDLNYVPHQAIDRPIQHVMSNSFGMGGQNTVLIFAAV